MKLISSLFVCFSLEHNYLIFAFDEYVQYAFALFYVVLRNWRSSLAYFITENEPLLEECWLKYDRLHLLTFLTDILQLLKTFQKYFESDTNTIIQIPNKKRELFERLENCINHSLENGWEERFLNEVDDSSGDMVFHGHKLETEGRTRNSSIYAFTSEKREAIVKSLLKHLNERLEYDDFLRECLKPLHPISVTSSTYCLQLCRQCIVPDFDESVFISEYRAAANLLQDYEFKSPLDTLRSLQELSTESFLVLKKALARLAAAKPHSADVERFISKDI